MNDLLNQTLQNIEIICIDDGSKDKTLDLLNEYATEYKNVRVFTQENQGVGKTRNRGITLAKAPYIIFLDVDDNFNKNMLKAMYKKAIETNSDIVLCDSRTIKKGKDIGVSQSINPIMLPNKKVFNYKDTPDTIFNITCGQVWDMLFKKDFIVQNKIQFPDLKNTEDIYFCYMSMALAQRITVIFERYVTYNLKITGSVSSTKSEAPTCALQSFLMLKKDLEKLGIYKDVEKSYLNAFLEVIVWNHRTIKRDARTIAREALLKAEPEIGILKRPGSYYYSVGNIYRRYSNIIKGLPIDKGT